MTVTSLDGSQTLSSDLFDITYFDNDKCGTAKAIASGKAGSAYEGQVAVGTFTTYKQALAAGTNIATASGAKGAVSIVSGLCIKGSVDNVFNGADSWAGAIGTFVPNDDGFFPPSEAAPVTLEYDFADTYRSGEDLKITRFVVSELNNYWYGSYDDKVDYRTSMPSAMTVYGSTDGENWTELVSASSMTLPYHAIIPAAKRGNWRRFRFKFTKNAGFAGGENRGTLCVQNIGIYSDPVYYAKTDGDSLADGYTWATATTLSDALSLANNAHFSEIHVQTGVYKPGATLTATKMLTIIGGYAGAGDDPDEITGYSTLDAEGAYTIIYDHNTSPGNYQYGYFTHLENIEFKNATQAGVNYTSGHASLEAYNCRFTGNRGNRSGQNNKIEGGRGICYQGYDSRTGQCVLKDCDFIDNGLAAGVGEYGTWDGSAVYIYRGYGTLENCLFASNGLAQTATPAGDGRLGMKGHAVYCHYALTAKNCVFMRNRGTVGWNNRWPGALGGATVCALSGGNVFERCLFVANEGISTTTSTSASNRGAMGTLTVAGNTFIDGCTFAYNLIDGLTASGGVNVNGGLAAVTNSIFYGNFIGTATSAGADIHVASGATLAIGNSFVSAAGAVTAADGDVELPESVVTGDPRFVTALDTVSAVKTADANNLIYFDPAGEATLNAIDVHLESQAGYRKNGDATWYTDSAFTSGAIDIGTGDCDNEPAPNGGKRNAGYYGNTAEASKTPTPPKFSIVELELQFMGAEGAATPVPSVIDSDSGETLSPDQVSDLFDITYSGNDAFGTAVITLTGKDGKAYAGQTVSANFQIAARYHVVKDVTEEGTGYSWESPVSLTNALALATRTTDEILVKAETYIIPETVYVSSAVTIRGGMAGTDDTTLAAEPYTVFDGVFTNTLESALMKINAASSKDEWVTIENFIFQRGTKRGFSKSG